MFDFIINIFGSIMNFIFNLLYSLGLHHEGLNIVMSTVVFTIIVYTLLLPFTISQQKFTRISAIMNPELQAIQKKYKNKKDQASMLKMQEETRLVYAKYGTSPMGGCLGSLIQLPFLFALFPVVRNFPKYIDKIEPNKVYKIAGIVLSGPEKDAAATPMSLIQTKNTWFVIVAIMIPLLAGFTQWLNMKISQNMLKSRNKENDTAQQMGAIMSFMPILSIFFCFSMQVVLGLYWIVSAVVRTIQQIVINKVLDKKSIDVIVEDNKKKIEKKTSNHSVRSRMINELEKKESNKVEKQNKDSNKEISSYKSNAKPGSLASKANMVSDFNNRNK